MRLIVLCLNDYPIGVYTTKVLADAAALTDWQTREPRWKQQSLVLGYAASQVRRGETYKLYHYHQHEFTVDALTKP